MGIKLNINQQKVFETMDEITREYIGGYENTLLDYPSDSEEYIEAQTFLKQGHESIKKFFYNEIISVLELEARFCGTDFILERIEKRLIKWGY